ncbi:hypothetical protein DVH05_012780 [Phytophthora capsici]|nr:hypothetical protein DVH05_012780 [Phytophthora capsici]
MFLKQLTEQKELAKLVDELKDQLRNASAEDISSDLFTVRYIEEDDEENQV